MGSMFEYLVLAAAFATLVGASLYIRSMFRGQTKPNRVTWFMWSVAPLIAASAGISSGAGWAAVPVLMSGISPLLVLIASFFNRKAYWKPSTFDYTCGVLSGLALVLWYITSNANLAIVLAMASDALAAVPTLNKAWRNPETESVWPFVIGIFSPATSFLVATAWTFPQLAFPTYLIVINILLAIPILRSKPPK
jgi:uncharacterized membrane protein HdeD (DUF308 family)